MPVLPNAKVWVDAGEVDVGTISMEMSKNRTYAIMAKCGNSTGIGRVDRTVSTTGILDLIGGFFSE